VDAAEVEAWAARHTARILAEMKLTEDPPTGLAEVALGIRAAYAKGYVEALALSNPPTILDVLNRECALRAMLPT
jgi:hypothetical protein